MASPNGAGDTEEDVGEIQPASTEPTNIAPDESSEDEDSDEDNGDVAYAVHNRQKCNERRAPKREAHSENKKRAYRYNERVKR